jgi:hypothetical protein
MLCKLFRINNLSARATGATKRQRARGTAKPKLLSGAAGTAKIGIASGIARKLNTLKTKDLTARG